MRLLVLFLTLAACSSATGSDFDSDGFPDSADCAPEDPDTFPGARDPIDEAGADTNCDRIDGVDGDGDGAALQFEDCDDGDATLNQKDLDGDGVTTCDGDCDDIDASRAAGFVEDSCDGHDADCIEDLGEVDVDVDGWFPCNGDCDDSDPRGHVDTAAGAGARQRGGARWRELGGVMEMSCARLLGNEASNDGGGLGAGWVAYRLTLDHAAVHGNVAGHQGGGLWFETNSTSSLSHLAISDNTAGDGGGGLYVDPTSQPLTLDHVALDGNSPNNAAGLPWIDAGGNVFAAPDYVDVAAGDARDWDVRLSPSSGLIGAGSLVFTNPDGTPTDIGALGGPGAADWDLDLDGAFASWAPGALDPALDADDLDPQNRP